MLVALGGWSNSPELQGAETWDLWSRLGAFGGSATLVARPLVRQLLRQYAPLTVADVAPDLVGQIVNHRAARRRMA